MGAARFEGVDILDSLGQIMELHTQHYKDDFDMDKELIQNLVLSGEPEDRRLLWMSRPCGTYTLREWEVYLEGSHANKVWRFYHEQTKDPILAYALSVKDVKDGKVTGTIYPLDYGTHVERVKSLTCPIGKVAVAFEDGTNFTLPYQERRRLMNELMPLHGNPKSMTDLPESETELAMILRRERFKRSYHAVNGDRTMKAGQNKKTVRVEFVMSEQDAELVKGRMAELGITNLSAYLRKMAVDGYIIHLDMGDIQEMVRLLRICSNNLNQYAKRANETGSVYAADVEDLRTRLDGLWDGMDKLLRGFANIS